MTGALLVVDDEGPLLRAMQRVLGKSFRVVVASSTTEALAVFTDDVGVVLTDFSMPDGDGLDLTRQLRTRGFRGAVGVLSAVVESDELQAALEAGVIDALISKPWRQPELIEHIHRLFDRSSQVPCDPKGHGRPVAA